jgi:hypothetical protein
MGPFPRFTPPRLAWLLAAAITLLNALKPAVVDDTAYLLFARHLAQHPLDPYGFEMFWSSAPVPAMEILMPPVLPYWLALGIALFGEHLFLLKLWLFPFALLLCRATASLGARFAAGQERTGLIVIAISPAVLVLFDFMLDVPAIALGLTALALFIRGCDRRSLMSVIGAGVLAGLAMQTKYSLLILPFVLVWYALLNRRWMYAVIAVSLAAGVFLAWESWLHAKYGHSHFLFHAMEQSDPAEAKKGLERIAEMIKTRLSLVLPLLGQFGGLMIGVALWAAAANARPAVSSALAVLLALLILPVLILPNEHWPHAGFTFRLFGFAAVGVVLAATWRTFRNCDPWDTAFLVGWVLLEVAGALGLSPFPAARRMLGVCYATSLLAVRAVAVSGVSLRWAAAGSVAFALFFFAIDCWDAQPEKVLAERMGEAVTTAPGETVWYNGHWGFQYYCDRAGMKPVIPYQSLLKKGDWLVYPVIPPGDGFYRPYHGGAKFEIDPTRTEWIATWTWDDALKAQTIPNLYGGGVPIENRNHPRLKVALYRITADWYPVRE